MAAMTATTAEADTPTPASVTGYPADVIVVENVTPPGQDTDTYRWKAAIAVARSNPGLYVKIIGTKPEYVFTSPVIIDGLSNIELAGLGTNRTVFRGQGSATSSLQALFATTGPVDGSTSAGPVQNVVFADFSVDGGLGQLTTTQATQRLRDARPFPSDRSTTLRSAILINGTYGSTGSGVPVPVVTNITVRNVSVYGTRELPIVLTGVTGTARIEGSRFERCLDVGFVSNEHAEFVNNTVLWSGDNGVSISRRNTHGLCENNVIVGSYFSGVLAGGNIDNVEIGPSDVTVRGNTITNTGSFGVDMTLAPQGVLVERNVIRNTHRIGIGVCGWIFDETTWTKTYDNPGPTLPSYAEAVVTPVGATQTKYVFSRTATNAGSYTARNITIQDNSIADSRRGGIAIYYAASVIVQRNAITFSPATDDLPSGDRGIHFYGVSNQGDWNGVRASASDVHIVDNTIHDTRTTANSVAGFGDGVFFKDADPANPWEVKRNVIRGALHPTTPDVLQF